jgi:hypothetical protein
MSQKNKGVAPNQPGRVAKPSKVQVSSKNILGLFDELTRKTAVLTKGDEEKLIKFLGSQELCGRNWADAEREMSQLKEELSKNEGSLRKLEMQLGETRELLASETDSRKQAEVERDELRDKLEALSSKHERKITRNLLAKSVRDFILPNTIQVKKSTSGRVTGYQFPDGTRVRTKKEVKQLLEKHPVEETEKATKKAKTAEDEDNLEEEEDIGEEGEEEEDVEGEGEEDEDEEGEEDEVVVKT